MTSCSDSCTQPLPGTAREGSVFVLLEHPGPWSHDILDPGTLNNPAAFADVPGLMLIRRAGREGRAITGKRNVYLAFPEENVIEHLYLDEDEVPNLDFSGSGRNNATRVDEPVFLVCTHAKRDRCCAVKGRPLVNALAAHYPQFHIWECSHAKGHRFAPATLLFPSGYSFGQISVDDAGRVLELAKLNRVPLINNRGRCIYTPPQQVAELTVAQALADDGVSVHVGDLTVEEMTADHTVRVTNTDNQSWIVQLEQDATEGVLTSCGKPAETMPTWRAISWEKQGV